MQVPLRSLRAVTGVQHALRKTRPKATDLLGYETVFSSSNISTEKLVEIETASDISGCGDLALDFS